MIISDGTVNGTEVCDAVTMEPLEGVTALRWSVDIDDPSGMAKISIDLWSAEVLLAGEGSEAKKGDMIKIKPVDLKVQEIIKTHGGATKVKPAKKSKKYKSLLGEPEIPTLQDIVGNTVSPKPQDDVMMKNIKTLLDDYGQEI